MENIVHLLGNPLLHITFITHFIFVSFDHNPIEKQKKQLGIFPGIIYTIKEQIQIVLTKFTLRPRILLINTLYFSFSSCRNMSGKQAYCV